MSISEEKIAELQPSQDQKRSALAADVVAAQANVAGVVAASSDAAFAAIFFEALFYAAFFVAVVVRVGLVVF